MSARGTFLKSALLVFLGLVAALTACTPLPPLPTPTRTPAPFLEASPTVNPLPPAIEGSPLADEELAIGRNSDEAAIAPNDMGVEQVVQLTSEAFGLPASSDGLSLQGVLYRAVSESAPVVVMLHAEAGVKEDWLPLIEPPQMRGYHVLAIDLRGHGVTGGESDWLLIRQDAADVMAALPDLLGVVPNRVNIIGAGVGANLALNHCAVDPVCTAVIAMNPSLNFEGITTESAVAQLGERPLLLIGDGDVMARFQELVPGQVDMLSGRGVYGTDLFDAQPDSVDAIVAWLARNG